MIRLLFSIAFGSTVHSVGAQDYHPFPMLNATWHISWGTSTCDSNGLSATGYHYYTDTDTLISSELYTKLKRLGVCPTCCPTLGPSAYDGYMGGLRQDTLNKKVYIVPSDESTEYLLFDFSMNVGDTLIGYLRMIPGSIWQDPVGHL